MERTSYRYRQESSFFFPIALITVGVVWLLVNNGMIAQENLYRLIPLWPLLLVGGGLSLLLRRLWWPLSALLWLAIAAGIVWALVYSPGFLPRMNVADLRNVVLSEPVGAAKSASVTLNLSLNPSTIRAADGDDLVKADIYVADAAELDVSGGEVKNVTLRDDSFRGDNFLNFPMYTQNPQRWNIGLTTQIPLSLEVDASTGSLEMDLSGVNLEKLNVQGSTGSMQITLPSDAETLPFHLDASTGSIDLTVPEGTGARMEVRASTGSINIDVPDGAGVRLEVTDSSLGSLSLPAGLEKISGAEDDEEGVYENAAYAASDAPIQITLDMSTGSVTIR